MARGRVLTGSVADEHGAARAFARVRATSERGRSRWLAETVADASGVFEVPFRPDGPVALAVEVAGWGPGGLRTAVAAADDDRIAIVIPSQARPSAFVTGALEGPDGRPVDGIQVRASRLDSSEGAMALAWTRAPLGSFRIGPLAPGSWVIDAWTPDARRSEVAEVTVADGQEADLGCLTMRRPGFLKVVAEGREDAAPSRIAVLDGRERLVTVLRPVAGFAASGPLDPGSYLLRGETGAAAPPTRRFEVQPGETVTVTWSGESSR
jgi:hypothetical protein